VILTNEDTFGSNITKNFEYFKSYYGTTTSIWQLFLDVGVIIGSGNLLPLSMLHSSLFFAVVLSLFCCHNGTLFLPYDSF
jgi:hypothetical protein